MAISASLNAASRWYNVSTCQGKASRTVIELAVRPEQSVVASGTECGREFCRDVIGHGTAKGLRTVPIRRVAAGVVAVRHRQVVIVVRVALVAVCCRPGWCHLVVARQRPTCARVAKRVVGPDNRVVTSRAV